MKKLIWPAALAVTLAALGGCASDGDLLLTGSIDEPKKEVKRVDPACVALMARIETLRGEGTPDRIAKVAAGKTATASVKREALARMTELDTANAEFQQKCSTLAAPKPATPAAAATNTAATTAATIANAAATTTASNAATAAKAAAAQTAATATGTAAKAANAAVDKAAGAANAAVANTAAAAQ